MDNKDQSTLFTVLRNGPLEVSGKFTMTGSDGKLIKTDKAIYLCRCGGSGNKPFCDDSHITNGFQS